MKNPLESLSSPRGLRILTILAVVGVIAVLGIAVKAIIDVGNQADKSTALALNAAQDRYDSCVRGNGVRKEIRVVAESLRGLVVVSVRRAAPVQTMTYEQRVAYERFKTEAHRLALAVERLGPVDCGKPPKEA